MTKLRCHAYTPDDRLALTVDAPWFSKKPPRCWGMPANQNIEPTLYAYPSETIYLYLDPPEWRSFTPTGGKR